MIAEEPLGMGLEGSELRTTVGDSSQVCWLLITAPSHLSSHALTAPSLHIYQSSPLFRPFAKEKQALRVYSTVNDEQDSKASSRRRS